MPEQDQFTQTAVYILTRLREIEREVRRLPGRIAQVPPGAGFQIWRELESTMTEYVNLVFRLVQMGGLAVPIAQPTLDLTRYSEETRAALYEAVVAVHWDTPPEHPEDFVPDYTPEEAGLQVAFLHGRWFAIWRMLEEPEDVPPSQRWEILRIEADPSSRFGVSFTGV